MSQAQNTHTPVVWPFPEPVKCKAVLAGGRYTHLCSRKAKRNGFCAYHDNRPELRAALATQR